MGHPVVAYGQGLPPLEEVQGCAQLEDLVLDQRPHGHELRLEQSLGGWSGDLPQRSPQILEPPERLPLLDDLGVWRLVGQELGFLVHVRSQCSGGAR